MKSFTSSYKVAPFILVMVGLIAITIGTGHTVTANNSGSVPASNEGGSGGVYLPLVANKLIQTTVTEVFGIQMYGTTVESNDYMPYLYESGADWVRIPVFWDRVEPSNVAPANYDWGFADQALAVAIRKRGRVIVTIDNAPSWAAPTHGSPIDEENLPDFAEFIGALVERYDGDGLDDAPGSPVVLHWEFYNEPDSKSDSTVPGWGDKGAAYAQMLSVAHTALKAANPEAYVVFGGIAYDFFEEQNGRFVRSFLDDVLQSGGGNYFDIMNFHTYPAFNENWAEHGPGLLQKAEAIRSTLEEHNVHKPMIISEAGWHSDAPPQFPSSQEQQARYVVELFTQSIAADIEVMIWWMLYDPGGLGWDNGLVTNDDPPQRKLSFFAFQTIIAELGTAQFERALSQAETGSERVEAYKFNDSIYNRTVYVAWLNPVDTTETRSLQLQAGQATIKNIYGDASVVSDGDDGAVDGQVTIQVGGQPVYIEIAR